MFWVFITLASSVLSLASVGLPQQNAMINPGFGMHLVVDAEARNTYNQIIDAHVGGNASVGNPLQILAQ